MKAMILAAGRGERMRPLTDTYPKPLLKVAGLALIEYHLFALQKAGFTEVVINHAWLGKKIEAYLGKGERYGLSIIYSAEQQALETAGGIIQAFPLLMDKKDKEKNFLVINGDIFTDFDFSLLLKDQQKYKSEAHLIMVENPQQHPNGDFFLSNGFLSVEKDKPNFTFSGIALYKANFFSGLAAGRRALAPLLKQKMLSKKVSGEIYRGVWVDVGTPERLQQLEKMSTRSLPENGHRRKGKLF